MPAGATTVPQCGVDSSMHVVSTADSASSLPATDTRRRLFASSFARTIDRQPLPSSEFERAAPHHTSNRLSSSPPPSAHQSAPSAVRRVAVDATAPPRDPTASPTGRSPPACSFPVAIAITASAPAFVDQCSAARAARPAKSVAVLIQADASSPADPSTSCSDEVLTALRPAASRVAPLYRIIGLRQRLRRDDTSSTSLYQNTPTSCCSLAADDGRQRHAIKTRDLAALAASR